MECPCISRRAAGAVLICFFFLFGILMPGCCAVLAAWLPRDGDHEEVDAEESPKEKDQQTKHDA